MEGRTLDCRGQRCPQPVIELARFARAAQHGEVVDILTDDPAAVVDIPAWCRMRRHHCAVTSHAGTTITHRVTIAGATAHER